MLVMSNKINAILLKTRDFFWENGDISCDECSLKEVCDEAEDMGLTYNLCSELDDEKFLSIIKEIGKDE